MNFLKKALKLFGHAVLTILMTWVITLPFIPSYAYGINLPEAPVSSQANIKETGKTADVKAAAKVADSQPTAALVLTPPEFIPAAITVSTATSVRFATVAKGGAAPDHLELQEYNPQTEKWSRVADLFDDGKDSDLFAGDLVYARRVSVAAKEEGQKFYRVQESQSGVVSSSNSLEVSRFPVGAYPRKPEFVRDEQTCEVFAAEQIVVSFSPSVSSERIEEIVEQVTKEIAGRSGSVIGYLPQINVFQVGWPVDRDVPEEPVRVAAVKKMVDEFKAYYEVKAYHEVRYAHPNVMVEFAATPDGELPESACKTPDDLGGQWGAVKIHANEAWDHVGTWSVSKKVAVVDTGVQVTHPDLAGNVVGDLGDASNETGGHGTLVAGIVAAKHDSAGISGIAYGLPIISFKVGASFSTLATVEQKIMDAADYSEVGIINFSANPLPPSPLYPSPFESLRCAFEYATYPETETVSDSCSGVTLPNEQPGPGIQARGQLGKGKLAVVAAGNQHEDLSIEPSYPCSWEDLESLLCVANTDQSDELYSSSNYGLGVDLTAPGAGVCTTKKGGGYSAAVGTSFSAPHVSGAAAVLWSKMPDWSAAVVAKHLKCTADHISDMDETEYAGKLGSGRLNLLAAVERIPEAINDDNSATEGGGAVSGNVISNDLPSGTPATVTEATQGGSSIPLGSAFTTANHGTLTLNSDGSYTYTPPAKGSVPPGGLSEEFNYTITDACSGATSDAILTVTVAQLPDRLVLVLDKSGSMAWSSHPDDPGCGGYATPPIGGCGPSRWEVLKQAVEQMLAVAGPYLLPEEDRFAVAFFDGNVDSSGSPSDRLGFTPFGPAINTFVSDPARTPGGLTSIGAGVTEFEEPEFIDGASHYHQTILLFTDGDQNQPPYLVTNDSEVLINQTENSPTGDDVHTFAPDVSICPFALLAEESSGPLLPYLQDIAHARCKDHMRSAISIGPSDPDLTMFLVQVLNGALSGDKLELLQVTSGQINRWVSVPGYLKPLNVLNGFFSQGRETFTTSRDDLAFTLLITWPEPGNGLKGVVLSKDGVDFQVTGTSNRIKTRSGDTYMAITLRQPYCNENGECVKSEGDWTLHMQPDFKLSNKFSYNLFVNADNASLASEFRVSQPVPGIGHPLRLTARLTENGKPIQGLTLGSVHAVLSRPRASLGNVLSKAKIEPVKPVQTLAVDPISAAGRKTTAMLGDPVLRESVLAAFKPSVEKELLLKETRPGLYEADYTDTRVSGIYSVHFYVEGESAGNGKFTRTFSSDRYVEVVVDERATFESAKVSPMTPCRHAGGCYEITLTPADSAGNLLGPGKAGLINVTQDFGKVLEPISDQLDGSYAIKVGYSSLLYPAGFQKKPVIGIQGIKIPVLLGK